MFNLEQSLKPVTIPSLAEALMPDSPDGAQGLLRAAGSELVYFLAALVGIVKEYK